MNNHKNMFLALMRFEGRVDGAAWKRLVKSFGEHGTVGDSNRKVNSPSTYRAVGPTCPSTCAYLNNGCYAQGGPVGMIQRRQSAEVDVQLRGVALALAWAIKTSRVARLHTSGDFVFNGEIDRAYVQGVIDLCEMARTVSGQRWVGWTYTHIPQEQFAAYRDRLMDAGMYVRWSDHAGAGGVVTMPFERADELRARGLKPLPCPSQVKGIDCMKCKACWNADNRVVMFSPHGSAYKRATAASNRLNIL